MSVFETLFNINCNEHTESKNGLTYLSWAFAWAEVKKHYPNANYTIYKSVINDYTCNYFTDGKTCWVEVGVTIEGLEHIEDLPVMDFKNKSIPFDSVTSFDVNKAIQRALTKACARHGLGLYIYAGEDLPEEEKKEMSLAKQKINETQLKSITKRLNDLDVNIEKLISQFKIKTLADLTNEMLSKLNLMLNAEEQKREKENKENE